MVQMEKFYGEKCDELEQVRKQNQEYEAMLANAKQEFVSLQEQFSSLSKTASKGAERSSDSDAELKILRRKLELAENKNKRIPSLEL